MPLQPGTKLGQYGILAKIGAGGMGEVYRARDTKLGREVAIKVLPEEFSQDKDRVARFEREARLLASLNHPHIATLHGFEESNGQKFLVMELVEGETLAERIAAGPIPMAEILPLFTQIAEGLVAAHERGVIHRDLKPANIKIAEDGNPKILDFGLAKAFVGEGEAADDSSESPTLTKGTALGVIMGTASYMSPEQARGKRVDKRTDIWAFGCCLYETLTGKKAFAGETVTDTISAVVRAEPDWRKLPAMLPSNVRHVMQLCLRKARATRLRDIGDVLLLLDGSPPMSTESKTSERQSRLPIWTVLLAILGGALVAGWGAWHLKPTAPTRMSRFKISLPPGSLHYGTGNLALSYDGTLLVYVARGEKQRQVFIRRMDRVDAVPLEGAVDAHEVLLSPDASTVAFFTAETGLTIKKINLDNLSATEVGEGIGYAFGAAWAPDGTIYFATSAMGLQSLPRGSNTVVRVAPGVLNGRVTQPNALPGSDWMLLQLGGFDPGQQAKIAAFSPSTQEMKTLVDGGTNPHYAESGHLVFQRGGSLLAVPFDPEHLETSGDPLPVLQGVDTDTFGGAAFDISPDGTLAYVPAQQALKKSLVWVDRSGGIEELLPEPKSYLGQSLSPDGERVAVSLRDENGDQIWVYEIERGVLSRFTFEGSNYNPHWSPDGKSILFSSHRDGLPGNLFVKPLDGSTPPERLTSNDFITVPLSWTNDDVILFETIRDRTGRDISFLKLSDPTQAQPLLETAYSEHPASLSPDSEWLVYASDETGRSEVYVRRFPNRGDKRQVSTGGGTQPVWARDGSEIFYRSGDRMMSVPITVDSEIRLGTSVTLFEGSFDPGEWGWVNYDVSRDGQRFAMLQPVVTTEPDEIVIVLNWFEELKRLVPPK